MKYLMVLLLVVSMGAAWANSQQKKMFEMQVENLLASPLENARYSAWGGNVSSPPRSIRPCEIGSLSGHKDRGTDTGTSGMVDWKIKEKDLTLIFFWSVPYSSFYCNSLGLAIYKGLESNEPTYEKRHEYLDAHEYFDDIYHDYENSPSNAENGTKTINNVFNCYHGTGFCTSNAGISVCGIMSINSDAKFNVRVSEVDNLLSCAGNVTKTE